MKESIHRYINLDHLPKRNNGQTDWDASIGIPIYYEYGDYCGELTVIKNNSSRLTILINDNEFEISSSSLRGVQLGYALKVYNHDYKYQIGDTIGNLVVTDRTKMTRPNTKKVYKYKCRICGYDCGTYYKGGIAYDELWIPEGSLDRGCKCSCCSHEITVVGINDIPTVASWMVAYFANGIDEAKRYSPASNKRVKMQCPICFEKKDNGIINTLYYCKSISCGCKDGIPYPEKFIGELLRQLHVDFIRQANRNSKWFIEESVKYRYDFGVRKENMIIETHGMQHYEENRGWGRCLRDVQINDKNKEDYAKEKGIENYIVLDCRYSDQLWIKHSVMTSKLPELFGFEEKDIDWIECERVACKSLVKEVADLKNNNPAITTDEICEKLNLGKSTVIKYIKQAKSAKLLNDVTKENEN